MPLLKVGGHYMKKYVICGVSNRALEMFIKPLLNEFSNENEIVGLLYLTHFDLLFAKKNIRS